MRSTMTDITTLTDTDLVDDLVTTHTRLTAQKARFILALAEFDSDLQLRVTYSFDWWFLATSVGGFKGRRAHANSTL